MIRDCSFEERKINCGNCVHASTNGWMAPAMNCAKGQKGCYQYIDNKRCGTTCEFFKGRNEYSFRLYGEEKKTIFDIIADSQSSDKI